MLAEAVAYCISGDVAPAMAPGGDGAAVGGRPRGRPLGVAEEDGARAAEEGALLRRAVVVDRAFGDEAAAAARPTTAPSGAPAVGRPPPERREAAREAARARALEATAAGHAVVMQPRPAAESPRSFYSR